jgi:uncharacterized protein
MPMIKQAREYYPVDDPVHGFSHVLRVFRLCEYIGEKEAADLRIVRAAALLHDVEGDVDVRENHHLAAARFAEEILIEEGWTENDIGQVIHCIQTHRFRGSANKPETIEAQVLFDADKLDAIGAIGIARAVAYAVRAGMDPYLPPSPKFIKTGEFETGESQTVAHEYFYKLRHIKDRLFTDTGRSLAVERHAVMETFFNQWLEEIGEYTLDNDHNQTGKM